MILTNGQNVKEAKLVMLGSTTVGKSSLVTRLTRDTFNNGTSSTIGAAFLSKTIQVEDTQVKLQIWDTGGSERYRAMAPMYFQNAQAAIIVFDITAKASFDDVETWLRELRDKGPKDIIIGLAGNKSDLDRQRVVSSTEAQEFADRMQITHFCETSALSGANVETLFGEIAAAIARGEVPSLSTEVRLQPKAQDNNPPPKKSGCCK